MLKVYHQRNINVSRIGMLHPLRWTDILDGFLKAEQIRGVRYTRFIGDGDSSVFPTLRETVPIWGFDIQKVECANHACKCYRFLAANNPSYKGKGGLMEKMRK